VRAVQTATVFTHRRPAETAPAIGELLACAREAGAVLRLDAEETRKHGLQAADGLELDADVRTEVDMCFALGGDGTILTALRIYAGTGVPVFAVNFGEIGFLATVERDEAALGFKRAFDGDFEVLRLPGLEVSDERGSGFPPARRPASRKRAEPESSGWLAINDVSIHRQPGKRVADLAYAVGADEIGRVRCDGLVVASPAGSTGYNLANGGPVMAWGVEGFAVSFIAPHSLTARSLVVAPSDPLVVHNRSREEPVDVVLDGRPSGILEPGEQVVVRFAGGQGSLAQVPGTTFYRRLSEKFGKLVAPLW
jgi:NAD+ kinase